MTTIDERIFAHLHVHTEFSLCIGVARIKELVARAKELGMKHLAITDYGALYGIIPFYKECKEQGIKPIIGCEVHVAPVSRHDRWAVNGRKYYNLVLLAENQTGFKKLVKLVSISNIRGPYNKPRVDKEILRQYHEGLICLSSGAEGEVYHAIIRNNKQRAKIVVQDYIDIFGRENYFLEIQNHDLSEEKTVNEVLVELAKNYGLGLVAANDCQYICQDDCKLYAILQCIYYDVKLKYYKEGGYDNGEYYLKSPHEMKKLFSEYPAAIANTMKIAERCQVDFTFGQMPSFSMPKDFKTDDEYLCMLCKKALSVYYSVITNEMEKRLHYELDMIKRRGLASYFLIMQDIIKLCREHEIYVTSQNGYLVGSVVAYVLGISNVDPLKINLEADDVLNLEHISTPKFLLSDSSEGFIMDGIMEYFKEHYGYESIAGVGSIIPISVKFLFQYVSRALGINFGQIRDIYNTLSNKYGTFDEELNTSAGFRRYYESSEVVKRVVALARGLEDLPGFPAPDPYLLVIAPYSLTDYLPVTEFDGKLMTVFPKKYLDELGLFKLNIASTRLFTNTMNIFKETVDAVEYTCTVKLDINNIPFDDKVTEKLLCEEHIVALPYLECLKRIIKDFTPKSFTDLTRKEVFSSLRLSGLSVAVLIWQSAYLKAHYPKEYMAAALNNEINDEYIKEAKRLGIKFLPADNKKVIVNLEWKRMEYAFLC